MGTIEDLSFETFRDDRRERRKQVVGNITTSVAKLIGAPALALLLSAQPAYSESIGGLSPTLVDISEQDAMNLIRLKLQAQIDGVFMQGGKYWYLLNDANLKIADLEDFKDFMVDFIGVLDVLNNNNALDGFDINAGVNLWIARKNMDTNPIEYERAYEEFVGPYTNPSLNITGLLDVNRFPHHGNL